MTNELEIKNTDTDVAGVLKTALDLHKNGSPAAAVPLYKKAIAIVPDNAQIYCLLGVALKQSGQLSHAIAKLEKAVAIDPLRADFLAELGIACGDAGDVDKAVKCLREAVPRLTALGKDDFVVVAALGDACFALGFWTEAIEHYRSALKKKTTNQSKYLNVQLNIGVALHHLEKRACAIKCYETILSVDPLNVGALTNLGVAHQEDKNFEESLALLFKAANIMPSDPLILSDLGVSLTKLNRTDEAIKKFTLALNEAPDYAKAWSNLGNAYQSQNKLTEAWEAHQRAIDLEPNNPELHWNLAMTLLLAGEYEQGWVEYEWRHKRQPPTLSPESPEWGGEPLNGKSILLLGEQGAGDAIQFARYAPILESEGAFVVLHVQTSLRKLFSTLGRNIKVLGPSDQLPKCDFQAQLMSIPYKRKERFENLPAPNSYLSVPSEPEVLLPNKKSGTKRIGIAWYGNPNHDNDLNRSCPFGELAPLFELEKIEWVSLQKEPVHQQIAGMIDPANQSHSFADTAAIISQLDLVVSVDTAVAHLAGALGSPVWIMLPYSSDWRWLTRRRDSPWYPSARLYRQISPGNWNSVITSIKSDLN